MLYVTETLGFIVPPNTRPACLWRGPELAENSPVQALCVVCVTSVINNVNHSLEVTRV